MQGTIRWFNQSKGYGFICPDDGSCDVFVEISAVKKAHLDTLIAGQMVSYEVANSRGKISAKIVQSVRNKALMPTHH